MASPTKHPEHRITEAEQRLSEAVTEFLSRPADKGPSQAMRLRRRIEDYILDAITESRLHWKTPERRRRDLLARAASTKPVVKLERAGCAQLMVLYGGMDGFLGGKGTLDGMNPFQFFRQSGLFARNLTWIRDPYGANFRQGIDSVVNSAEALADWTTAYARSLAHVREVHGIGYSSGSYGALLFGHLCRMNTVWVFGPRGSRLETAAEDKAWLRNLLSVHNGVTRYYVWYSHGNRYDCAFAENLADCPGVTLHATRASDGRHALLRYLAEHGALRTILPRFLPVSKNAGPAPVERAVAEARPSILGAGS
jgi:hypothetical protein